MKIKICFIIIVLLTGFLSAQNRVIEINAKGDVRLSSNEEWVKINVEVEPKAENYKDYFLEAISSPDKFIVAYTQKRSTKITGLSKGLSETLEKGIVLNSLKNTISVHEVRRNEEVNIYFLITALISLLLMIFANIYHSKFWGFTLSLFSTIFIILTLHLFYIPGIDDNPLITFSAFGATIAATYFSAVCLFSTSKMRHYNIAAIIYYCFMITFFALLFI